MMTRKEVVRDSGHDNALRKRLTNAIDRVADKFKANLRYVDSIERPWRVLTSRSPAREGISKPYLGLREAHLSS